MLLRRWRASGGEGPHFINVLMATCILIENNQIKPPLQTDIWRWALYLRGHGEGEIAVRTNQTSAV